MAGRAGKGTEAGRSTERKQSRAPKAAQEKNCGTRNGADKAKDSRVFISQADEYLFAQGTHYDIYKKLGAHPSVERGKKGMYFAVWAPHAEEVYVIGSFNGWDERACILRYGRPTRKKCM